MQKLIKFLKSNLNVLVVVLISIPSFFLMIKSGIYSVQDFHLFRLYEFDKCVKEFQIPCRWAPDAGLGYGEPLFNFYGQLPYAVGEIFYLLGLSLIDSVKLLFILSLVISAIGMYLLSKKIWHNSWASLLSSILYLYAPYRAVDVWVRGALPEALSFAIFPFIILAIENKKFWGLVIGLSILISTHNLSVVMFLPFLLGWLIYKKYWEGLISIVAAFLINAFYILPVIFESKFVNLLSTTQGYFDFRAHFITLSQIFFDFSWGYGGSTWGIEDGLNLSVGVLQWAIPLIAFMFLLTKKEWLKDKKFLILLSFGLFYLFLSHNKSTFIWNSLDFMKYIQFPWRFLGLAVFCLSLASGIIFNLINKKYAYLVLIVCVLFTSMFTLKLFKPDIWYSVTDEYFLTGEEWDRQRSASIGDFWPNFGHNIPNTSNSGEYINYFPGWKYSGEVENGLIKKEGAVFTNTPIRSIANIISLVSICLSILIYIFF